MDKKDLHELCSHYVLVGVLLVLTILLESILFPLVLLVFFIFDIIWNEILTCIISIYHLLDEYHNRLISKVNLRNANKQPLKLDVYEILPEDTSGIREYSETA